MIDEAQLNSAKSNSMVAESIFSSPFQALKESIKSFNSPQIIKKGSENTSMNGSIMPLAELKKQTSLGVESPKSGKLELLYRKSENNKENSIVQDRRFKNS